MCSSLCSLIAEPKLLLASLDYNCGIRFATFQLASNQNSTSFFEKRLNKSYIATLPDLSAPGILRSMAMMNSTNMTIRSSSTSLGPLLHTPYMILGASATIRLYSIDIFESSHMVYRSSEFRSNFHVKLNLLHKIVVGFIPDYLNPFKISDMSSIDIDFYKSTSASNYDEHLMETVLIANELGQMSLVCFKLAEKNNSAGEPWSPSRICSTTNDCTGSNSIQCLEAILIPLNHGPSSNLEDTLFPRSQTDGSFVVSSVASQSHLRETYSSPAVVVSEVKGKVSILHSPSGLLLTPPGTVGVNNNSCLAASGGWIAMGSRSGRISVYDSGSMTLVKLVDPDHLDVSGTPRVDFKNKRKSDSAKTHKLVIPKTTLNVIGKVLRGKLQSKSSEYHNGIKNEQCDEKLMESNAVNSMMFIYGGKCLIANRKNKGTTVCDLRNEFDGITVKRTMLIPPRCQLHAKSSQSDGNTSSLTEINGENVSVYICGSFVRALCDTSSENIVDELRNVEGIWGLLHVSAKAAEMEVYRTILPVDGEMQTEKLAVVALEDEKVVQTMAKHKIDQSLLQLEARKQSKSDLLKAKDDEENFEKTMRNNAIEVVGAHINVSVFAPAQNKNSKLKGISWNTIDNTSGGELVLTVVALAKVPGEASLWAMTGRRSLSTKSMVSEQRKSVNSSGSEIADNDMRFMFATKTSSVAKAKKSRSTPSVQNIKTVALGKALRLGSVCSHSFLKRILAVATDGGVRVYDINALLVQRDRHLSSAANFGGPRCIGSSQSNDNLLDIVSASSSSQEKLRVCIGSYGGIDSTVDSTITFGPVNWSSTILAINGDDMPCHRDPKYDNNLPDIYLCRSDPPSLIKLKLSEIN